MTHNYLAFALIAAAAPVALVQGGVEGGAAPEQVAPLEPSAPAPDVAAQGPASSTPSGPPLSGPMPSDFDSQVAFSPTYSSGYYYASPYSGYTSLSFYGSIYTARRFGG